MTILESRLLQGILWKYNYPELFSPTSLIHLFKKYFLNSCYVPGARLWGGPKVLPFGILILRWLLRSGLRRKLWPSPLSCLRESEEKTYSDGKSKEPNLNSVQTYLKWKDRLQAEACFLDPHCISLFLSCLAEIYLPCVFRSSSTTCKLPTSF